METEHRVLCLLPFAKKFDNGELFGSIDVSKEEVFKVARQLGGRERLKYYAHIIRSNAEALGHYVKLILDLADTALASKCYDLADDKYRGVIRFGEIDPTFTRRAQIGIDDIRAARR